MCCPTWISSTMTKRLSSRYCLCPWMWTTIPLTTDVAVTLTFVLVHSAPCISMKQNIHDLQKMDDLILVSKIALGRQPRLRWGQETQAVGIMGQPPVTSPQGILSLLGLTRNSFTFEKQKLSSPPEHPGSRSVFLASCFTLRTKATVQGHTWVSLLSGVRKNKQPHSRVKLSCWATPLYQKDLGKPFMFFTGRELEELPWKGISEQRLGGIMIA